MYRIVIVFLLLFTIACGQADRVPDGILSKEDMRDVLIDMNMADVYSSENGDHGMPLPDSVRQHQVKIYFSQILQLHKLTHQQFKKSYDFYESHPDRLKEVYDMMKDVVTAEKDVVENESRIKEYINNPKALLPFGKNVLISDVRDTIIPFVKKNKRVNFKQ
ncbi:protein of unknown function [Chitinophaga sp. CF118]|uniref:DUF4296 domain-containing protein n=1 Tax=Chitinophaga sp. CF118 TaxID=1884367 RepID=UPI0008E519D2|nr:DUF4296 domain-containing protein [Chitinophaga sp. CF118]SFD12759.1 protein of unknown function [Chitinophaga sp. CF118]